MNEFGHYETLGVDPEAAMTEIRQAYLAAARAAHPDLHRDSDQQRVTAEARMREVNAAWAVLGDVDQRSAYDRVRLQRSAPGTSARATTDDRFVPFDDGPDPEFDERHDHPISNSALPGWLSFLPMVGGVLGGALLVLGGLRAAGPVSALGMVMLVVSALLMLVAAPLLTLGRAARADRS